MSDEAIVQIRKVIEVVTEGIQGPRGILDPLMYVIGDVPADVINGSNATFTTTYNFIPESVAVFINGILQKRIQDFNTTGMLTVMLAVSPQVGDIVLVNYLRS